MQFKCFPCRRRLYQPQKCHFQGPNSWRTWTSLNYFTLHTSQASEVHLRSCYFSLQGEPVRSTKVCARPRVHARRLSSRWCGCIFKNQTIGLFPVTFGILFNISCFKCGGRHAFCLPIQQYSNTSRCKFKFLIQECQPSSSMLSTMFLVSLPPFSHYQVDVFTPNLKRVRERLNTPRIRHCIKPSKWQLLWLVCEMLTDSIMNGKHGPQLVLLVTEKWLIQPGPNPVVIPLMNSSEN